MTFAKGCEFQTFKKLSWTAVIVWMAFIFLLSHQPAEESRELSRGMTEVIVEKLSGTAVIVWIGARLKNGHGESRVRK